MYERAGALARPETTRPRSAITLNDDPAFVNFLPLPAGSFCIFTLFPRRLVGVGHRLFRRNQKCVPIRVLPTSPYFQPPLAYASFTMQFPRVYRPPLPPPAPCHLPRRAVTGFSFPAIRTADNNDNDRTAALRSFAILRIRLLSDRLSLASCIALIADSRQ